LGRGLRHLERHRALFGRHGRLLGDDRLHDDIVVLRFGAHFRRASRASTPALVITRVSRRRMSYTLAPIDGSTSRPSMLAAARAKFSFTEAPSMTSVRFQPRAFIAFASAPVLASLISATSRMTRLPSFCLAESAWRRPRARNFFGRSWAWLRGVGPL